MYDKAITRQLMKFNMYGFFKNLRFFDPFLLLYLTYNNLTLTQIGFLWAIREVVIYVLEIPSGVFADNYGRKLELVICFIFYIASFVMFYLGSSFSEFVIAFALYGFGEALRSGTHKAMILEFLDYHKLTTSKSKVYGKTRSYSMIGSAVSSIFAILLIKILPELSMLFLVAIIPYIIDFFLILSYPNYLNTKTKHKFSFSEFLQGTLLVIATSVKEVKLRKVLLDSASYNAIFKTIKDYIQIIIFALLISSIGNEDNSIEIIIGIVYAGMFILSAIASRYSHLLLTKISKDKLLRLIWIASSVTSVLLVILGNSLITTIGLFSLFYVLLNIRKPIMVEKISEEISPDLRASILSVESQLTSLLIIVLAPLFGFIFDRFGINYVFVSIAVISIVSTLIYKKKTTIFRLKA